MSEVRARPPAGASFYPSLRGFGCVPINTSTIRPRPITVGPIFDLTKTSEPLPSYGDVQRTELYGKHHYLDAETVAPSISQAVSNDAYLYPPLSTNEYIRLTTLWYHTYGLDKDAELIYKFEPIVSILQESFSWEFAIVGLLDNDTYMRLATANLPLAILPRRESTCSHTVQMHPGTVFSVSDMSNDWRFEKSPHVAIGGLRSYAGLNCACCCRTAKRLLLAVYV